jgi:hypothetical protein
VPISRHNGLVRSSELTLATEVRDWPLRTLDNHNGVEQSLRTVLQFTAFVSDVDSLQTIPNADIQETIDQMLPGRPFDGRIEADSAASAIPQVCQHTDNMLTLQVQPFRTGALLETDEGYTSAFLGNFLLR